MHAPLHNRPYHLYPTASPQEKADLLKEAAAATGAALDGLDLQQEIQATDTQRLGDTLLLFDDALAGLAVCHVGAGTEAGTGACYVKFGTVRTGHASTVTFERLLDACFSYAATRGAGVLIAGSNAARVGACEVLFRRGFRTQIQGVAMQRHNKPGFNRPDVYTIDDWR